MLHTTIYKRIYIINNQILVLIYKPFIDGIKSYTRQYIFPIKKLNNSVS